MKRKRLKRRFKSKGKGSAFERKVCAQLSMWITGGKNKDCFWRSSMSGGRATIHVARGQKNRQAGDIAAVAPEGHILTDYLFIECKAVRDLHIPGFILSNVGPMAKFWVKACQQAAEHLRTPMLIAKQNNHPVLVLTVPHIYFDQVKSHIVINRPDEQQALLFCFDDLLKIPFQASIKRVQNGESSRYRRTSKPTTTVRRRLGPAVVERTPAKIVRHR